MLTRNSMVLWLRLSGTAFIFSLFMIFPKSANAGFWSGFGNTCGDFIRLPVDLVLAPVQGCISACGGSLNLYDDRPNWTVSRTLNTYCDQHAGECYSSQMGQAAMGAPATGFHAFTLGIPRLAYNACTVGVDSEEFADEAGSVAGGLVLFSAAAPRASGIYRGSFSGLRGGSSRLLCFRPRVVIEPRIHEGLCATKTIFPGRFVDVKMNPGFLGEELAAQAFGAELNLVRILENNPQAGIPRVKLSDCSYRMKFIDGPTIIEYLRDNPCARESVIQQIAKINEHLNNLGFRQHDINPSNYLVDRLGVVYLIDFDMVRPSEGSFNCNALQIVDAAQETR